MSSDADTSDPPTDASVPRLQGTRRVCAFSDVDAVLKSKQFDAVQYEETAPLIGASL